MEKKKRKSGQGEQNSYKRTTRNPVDTLSTPVGTLHGENEEKPRMNQGKPKKEGDGSENEMFGKYGSSRCPGDKKTQ